MDLFPLNFWCFEWMKKILNVVKIVVFMREGWGFVIFSISLFIPLLAKKVIVIDIRKNLKILTSF